VAEELDLLMEDTKVRFLVLVGSAEAAMQEARLVPLALRGCRTLEAEEEEAPIFQWAVAVLVARALSLLLCLMRA